MNHSLISRFSCPKCGEAALSLREADFRNDEIEAGFLDCPQCQTRYPIVRSLPRFVSQDNYADSFGFQWNRFRKTQLDSNTGLSITRDRLFEVTDWPETMVGETILEAGSGAGRFTEVLLNTGATVISFDLSTAVDANQENNGHHSNLILFQGDILKIPVHKATFDKVLCLGVLQHTPNPEAAFKNLAEYVCPGGKLVIDVYSKRLIFLLNWKYLLRPITRGTDREKLYELIESVVPPLLPLSILLRQLFGRFGSKLVPIVQYSHLGLSYELNKQWAILDTFDMYSPIYDNPQSIHTVKDWFDQAGFIDVTVQYGLNGIVGRGKKPL